MGTAIVFSILALIILAGSVWVVTLRNLFRAALSLGLVLIGIAGLFVLLEAEFLAFVQILVYVGAILTLVIFAIMLTTRLQTDQTTPASRQVIPAAGISVSVFVILIRATQPLLSQTTLELAPLLAALGQHLVTQLVLPFEVVSLVFVAVIAGSIAVASARDNEADSPKASRP